MKLLKVTLTAICICLLTVNFGFSQTRGAEGVMSATDMISKHVSNLEEWANTNLSLDDTQTSQMKEMNSDLVNRINEIDQSDASPDDKVSMVKDAAKERKKGMKDLLGKDDFQKLHEWQENTLKEVDMGEQLGDALEGTSLVDENGHLTQQAINKILGI
ncbi:hypothetical protein V6R21_31870 [Limibacter armeniacum]|uniref:hypothetical protein n=1 Tax=Limibacter armeniacum TaxID=466084 RepID=UPI002FE51BCB